MTKRERAQVVELLRCAADLGALYLAGYALGHCDGIDPCSKPYSLAMDVSMFVHGRMLGLGISPRDEQALLLEAAQRVEEGSWP